MAFSDYVPSHFRRMLKFGVVGVSNTVIDFILYVLLTKPRDMAHYFQYRELFRGVVNSFILNRSGRLPIGNIVDGLAHQLSMFLFSNVSGRITIYDYHLDGAFLARSGTGQSCIDSFYSIVELLVHQKFSLSPSEIIHENQITSL